MRIHTIAVLIGNVPLTQFLTIELFWKLQSGLKESASLFRIIPSFIDSHEHFPAEALKSYDGAIGLIPPDNAALQRAWERYARTKPCVSLLYPPRSSRIPYVGVDDEAGIGMLVDHLFGEGHRSIAFAVSDYRNYSERRTRAFVKAMKQHNLTLPQSWIPFYDTAHDRLRPATIARTAKTHIGSKKHFDEIAKYYITLDPHPRAIVCEHDQLAYALMLSARKHRIRIPEDIAITGFDNISHVAHYDDRDVAREHRRLTSVDQNLYETAAASMRLMSQMLRGKRPRSGERLLVMPALITRRSSRIGAKTDDGGFAPRISAYIDRNFADSTLMERVADHAGMSHEYFLKRFKKEFGVSFHAHLNERRMTYAAGLIARTTRSLLNIALTSGFRTYENFFISFRKRFAESPVAYRKSHRR
ncbi:MAG: substrate-binding domain-containing protein [Spirochaetes bacterium]|nr:substrate-binding domain-containing protein [Spirochaetota bacterium]